MSGYLPGTLRVWDGTAWRLSTDEWVTPDYEVVMVGASSVKTNSTTSCSRSPGTVHSGAHVTVTASTTGRNGGNLVFYKRIGSGAWAQLSTKAAPSGGGNVSVNDTPTKDNTQYMATFTGSSSHKSSSSSATSGVSVQTKHTTTKTINIGWSQAYNGAGNKISGSGADNAVHQGYYSSTHGNRKSLLRFDPGLPAGSEVTKVVLDCNGAWSHWYAGSGGTVVAGYFLNQDTLPTSWPAAKVSTDHSRKAVNLPGWELDISGWACTAIENAAFSGITIGPGPTTSLNFYGYSDSNPSGADFQLHVTYSYWG